MPYQRVQTSVKQAIIDAFPRQEDYVKAAKLLGVKRTIAPTASFDNGRQTESSSGKEEDFDACE